MPQRIDIKEALELIAKSFQTPIPDNLAKAWTQPGSTTTGLATYALEAPAKLLFPVLTPLRNDTPRVGGGRGTADNWRAITGINTTNIDAGVTEGRRGGVISHTTADYTQGYKGIGLEDNVTFEADYAAEGFDDVKARAMQGTLWSTMIQEEKILLAGNNDLALGTTPTPTLSTATTGGTLANAAAASVICVALTQNGWQTASVSAAGVRGQVSRTNADGTVDTYGGGSAQQSANATIATTGSNTSTVSASVTAVNGAYAYAWFYGASAGAERIVAITTINSVKITAAPAGDNQLASAITNPAADNSTNSTIFNGYMTFAMKPGSGAYINTLPTGTAGTGTVLTSGTDGSIPEIDQVLQYMWDTWRISPDEIWVASQQAKDIRAKILAGGANSAARFVFDMKQESLRGGTMAISYLNPFGMPAGSDYAQGKELPIKIHPDMPPGTIYFRTKMLPYKLSNVGNIAEVKTRRDYYAIEWPLRTRLYEYGVYADEMLKCYAPFSYAVLRNIAPG